MSEPFLQNEWGFYAMAGNVAEWTSSRYAAAESASLVYIDDDAVDIPFVVEIGGPEADRYAFNLDGMLRHE